MVARFSADRRRDATQERRRYRVAFIGGLGWTCARLDRFSITLLHMDGRPVRNGRPGPRPPTPPIPKTAQLLAMVRWPFTTLALLQRHYGSAVMLRWPANPPRACLSASADAAAVFRAPAETLMAGVGATPLAPIVGEQSFMLADGERHLRARRALAPSFQRREVERHADTIRTRALQAISSWPRGRAVELYPRLRDLTLWTILDTIFEVKDPRLEELHARLLELLSISEHAVLTVAPARHVPPGKSAWSAFLRQRDAVDRLLAALIADHSRHVTTPHGLLTAALRLERDGHAGAPARDTLMSVILAGHETTASTLAWALQLLAHHPRVLERTVAAVDADDAEYLTAVVQEVLRHRPVFVFAMPRAVARPVRIGRHLFHRPEELVPSIYLVHHDESVYRSPHRFCPERFVGVSPRPDAWIPWGGGLRRCPGVHLATLELRIVLEAILSNLTVKPTRAKPEGPLWRSVIVTPRGGCRVVLHDRR